MSSCILAPNSRVNGRGYHRSVVEPHGVQSDVFVSYAHIDDQALAEGQPGWIRACIVIFRFASSSCSERKRGSARSEAAGKRYLRGPSGRMSARRRRPRVGALSSVRQVRMVPAGAGGIPESRRGHRRRARGGQASRLQSRQDADSRGTAAAGSQAALGYDFFMTERASGRQRELDLSPLSGPDAQRLYWTKLDDLAQDIKDLLTILEGRASGNTPSLDKTRGTVYVAETSSDVKERRDSIRRELAGHNTPCCRTSRCRSRGRNAPRSFASSFRNAACRCTWSVRTMESCPTTRPTRLWSFSMSSRSSAPRPAISAV